MAKLKKLTKGKCLEDLKVFYQLPSTIKGRKPNLLLNNCNKQIQDAERCGLDGDEEQSYIHYMTFLGIVTFIKQQPNYNIQRQAINEILGGKAKVNAVLDKAEKLSKSLTRRYDEQRQQEMKLAGINFEEQIAMQKSLREQIKTTVGDSSYALPVSEAERNKRRNQKDSLSLMHVDKSISCQELFAKITNTNNVLVIDCRSIFDYQQSHIKYQYCLSVPEEILMPGMSASKLFAELSDADKNLWVLRSVKDHVVLMDWRTPGPDSVRNTSLYWLQLILQNFDPDVEYKSLKILEDGYENFQLLYPMMCTNPSYKPNHSFGNSSQVPALDDIEYPNIGDITMKDASFGQQPTTANGRPDIDRGSKVAALHKYEEKAKQVSDILAQQEKLASKSLVNEQERLEVETEWDAAHVNKEKVHSDEEKHTFQQLEKKFEYDLMQLEDKQKDIELENNTLREKLEYYMKREQAFKDKEKALADAEIEAEAMKRIKAKEHQRQQIDQQRALMEQERLKKLEQSREQKRKAENVVIPRPKMPQFDRTVKPNVITDVNHNYQRDFAPVFGCPNRGLTGLKNLGNTCYMNSIMQCLSNTSCLVEYVIEDSYVTQINRDNKTHGRIIEEVAAVIKALWRGEYKFIASKDLRYVIGEYEQIFRGIEQQDSHEFLTILMDWMHSDLQTIPSQTSHTSTASEKAWQQYTKSKESMILQMFYGQIKSTVKCLYCEKESATYESFSNLSLELPQNTHRCKIQDCLGMYFNGESISGFDCPNCKQRRNAVKKLDISKLPPILVIHFKRFYADHDSVSYRKKQNYVNFPLSELDMAPFVAPSERKNQTTSKQTYHLYGVSNHYGSMEGGHYTAFCKSMVAKKWYKFDDHMVSSLDPSDVESSAAYILFYSQLPERQLPVRWT